MKLPTPEEMAKQGGGMGHLEIAIAAHAVRSDREAIAKCVEELRRPRSHGDWGDGYVFACGQIVKLLRAEVKP